MVSAGNMCSSPRGWSRRAPPSRPGSCWPGWSPRSPRTSALAAFAALVYLTSDALVYHGWLAYTDPLFAFFTFAAIACLWVATMRRSIALVWIAVAAISCAALTKGQTAYLFYAVAALVLLCRRDLRTLPAAPAVIVPHLAAAALYFVWHRYLTGGAQQSTDFSARHGEAPRFELARLPASALVVSAGNGAALRAGQRARRVFLVAQGTGRRQRRDAHDASVAIGAWIAGSTTFRTGSGRIPASRYVMPLYPLAAFLIAYVLWRQAPRACVGA